MIKPGSWLIVVGQTRPSIAADGDGLVRHTIPVQGKGNGAVASMNHCRKQACVAICLQ